MTAICETNQATPAVLTRLGRKQRTLSKTAVIEGEGLFTGKYVRMTLHPAPENTGIVFKRVDLPESVQIPARLGFVKDALRCTMLSSGQVSVQTIEHFMAACYGMGIDNLLVEINGPEVPILDGSAKDFAALFKELGVQEQNSQIRELQVVKPIYFSQGDIHMVALPSDEFRVSFTLHYPNSSLLQSQFYSIALTPEVFETEIAPCRTFAFYEEIAPLIEKGYIKGGGLKNALIIREEMIINPEGVRFPEEMVRHKVLDVIGDLSLIGSGLLAHIIAIRSGHASNIKLAQKILESS